MPHDKLDTSKVGNGEEEEDSEAFSGNWLLSQSVLCRKEDNLGDCDKTLVSSN